MIKITLPIPSSDLSPNKTSGHVWQKKNPLKETAKKDGFYSAAKGWASNKLIFCKESVLRCQIIVYHANNKHLDDDNLLAALKPYQDGIFLFFESKLGKKVSDKQIKYRTLDTRHIDKHNPRIVMLIDEIAPIVVNDLLS